MHFHFLIKLATNPQIKNHFPLTWNLNLILTLFLIFFFFNLTGI